jgi:hypothetical protein
LNTPQKAELLFADAGSGPWCHSKMLATARAGTAASTGKVLLATHA